MGGCTVLRIRKQREAKMAFTCGWLHQKSEPMRLLNASGEIPSVNVRDERKFCDAVVKSVKIRDSLTLYSYSYLYDGFVGVQRHHHRVHIPCTTVKT